MTEPVPERDTDMARTSNSGGGSTPRTSGLGGVGGDTPRASQSRAKDHSPWNWLLFVPIIVPLLTPLFNADAPRLGGIPRFYWLQLSFIVLGVGSTTLVYQMTKKRR